MPSFHLEDVKTQEAALGRMMDLVAGALSKPGTGAQLVQVARAITSDCDARDDRCEVEAILDAVKNGTDKIPGLEKGVRYVSDPRTFDYYSSAAQTLKACRAGACAGDCDDQAILITTLLVALGYKAGLRAWGPKVGRREYEHVYAVVALPKHGPWPKNYSGHGLDSTVPESFVGWEPRKGEVLTYWIEEG